MTIALVGAGGYLGFIGINRYDPAFEDAAFALATDGAISEPVETRVGYHVLKRISRRAQGDYADEAEQLEARVKRMPRYEIGRGAMVRRLRERYGFRQNSTAVDEYAARATDSLFQPKYAAPALPERQLFSFGEDVSRDLSDFAAYVENSGSRRLRMRAQPPADAIRGLYDAYVDEETMAYAERRLGMDNPAFYNLMREYEEGILLFEATKLNVWDEAGRDTVGLEAFYAANTSEYAWDERLGIDYYTFPLERRAELERAILKRARKRDPERVLSRFNADSTVVEHEYRAVERGREPIVDALQWREGTRVPAVVDERRGDAACRRRAGRFCRKARRPSRRPEATSLPITRTNWSAGGSKN